MIMNSLKFLYYMAVMSQTLYNTEKTPIESPISKFFCVKINIKCLKNNEFILSKYINFLYIQ